MYPFADQDPVSGIDEVGDKIRVMKDRFQILPHPLVDGPVPPLYGKAGLKEGPFL